MNSTLALIGVLVIKLDAGTGILPADGSVVLDVTTGGADDDVPCFASLTGPPR